MQTLLLLQLASLLHGTKIKNRVIHEQTFVHHGRQCQAVSVEELFQLKGIMGVTPLSSAAPLLQMLETAVEQSTSPVMD